MMYAIFLMLAKVIHKYSFHIELAGEICEPPVQDAGL